MTWFMQCLLSICEVIWCFKCTQVQAVLRRHWNQHNIQFGSSVGNHSDALRSASYTASSITEVQGCYSIDSHSEHMNGKGFHDIDPSMLKPDSPFAWQWSPPLPQPPINFIMLASSCRSNEWRFLLYICHMVFLYLWDWFDIFLCLFLFNQFSRGCCPKMHTDNHNIVANFLSDKVVFKPPNSLFFFIGLTCTQTACKFFANFSAKPSYHCLFLFYTQKNQNKDVKNIIFCKSVKTKMLLSIY